MIINDILFDNQHLNPEKMCLFSFKSISTTRLLPVFKYSSKYVDFSKNPKLVNFINERNSINKIISNTAKKTINNLPFGSSYTEVNELISNESNFNKKAGILLKSIDSIDINTFKKICQELSLLPCKDYSAPNFKRCVMCIDFIENGTQFK